MTKKRDVIISSGKGSPITIGKKERRTDLLPEHQKDYEEKCVQVLNEKNNTNFKTFQECSNEGLIQVIQIPIDYESNGIPIGKLFNQAHYWIANDDYKKARTLLKSAGLSGLQAKLYVKDEIKLQKRNPKEKEKYQNKPLPEELKLISDLLN